MPLDTFVLIFGRQGKILEVVGKTRVKVSLMLENYIYIFSIDLNVRKLHLYFFSIDLNVETSRIWPIQSECSWNMTLSKGCLLSKSWRISVPYREIQDCYASSLTITSRTPIANHVILVNIFCSDSKIIVSWLKPSKC